MEESSSSEVDHDLLPRSSISHDVSTIPTNESGNESSNAAVIDEPAVDERDFASESELERLSCPPKPGSNSHRVMYETNLQLILIQRQTICFLKVR